SSAQAVMLQGLFSGATVDEGRGHPVTAVGDPFQAIYGWRGAAASNITQFDQDFPMADGAPARSFGLTVNRRSGHTILAAANDLAAPLRAATGAAGDGTDEGSTSEGGTSEGSGAGDGIDTRLVAPPEAGPGEVHGATFTTWPEEVEWVCDRIVELGP